MKKKLLTGLATIALSFGIYQAADAETVDPDAEEYEYTVDDFFPLTHNYHAQFQGEGNEFASYEVFYDFIDGEYIQSRTLSGTSLAEIYQVTEDAVYLWYQEGEIYVRENFISRVRSQADVPLDVLIKAPLEAGHYWETARGGREITGVNEELVVGDITYHDVLVVQVYPEFEIEGQADETVEMYEYYAPGAGLVKEEYISTIPGEEPFEVTSELEGINAEGWYETVTIYVPDEQGMYLQPVQYDLFVETNDYMREEFRSIFAGEHEEIPQIAPNGLTINHMYTHWNYNRGDNRLFVDFSDEITELRGSTLVLMTIEAMMHTIQDYYYGVDINPTVEYEPFHADGIQFYEGEVYVPDASLVQEVVN